VEELSERVYAINDNAIKRLRVERGLSWEQLADKAGIHVTTLRAWRKGRRAYISSINRLAVALGASMKEIIYDNLEETECRPEVARNYEIEIFESFADWDKEKQDKFLEGLRLILETGSGIKIIGNPMEGSVRLIPQLTPEQGDRLERAFDTRQLLTLNIIDIKPLFIEKDFLDISFRQLSPQERDKMAKELRELREKMKEILKEADSWLEKGFNYDQVAEIMNMSPNRIRELAQYAKMIFHHEP
jgi:transcriptional regulator with XRE-family HTH domain